MYDPWMPKTGTPSASAPPDANVLDTSVEDISDELMPVGRYNAKRLDDRLTATR
jgi:hypothetical protein